MKYSALKSHDEMPVSAQMPDHARPMDGSNADSYLRVNTRATA